MGGGNTRTRDDNASKRVTASKVASGRNGHNGEQENAKPKTVDERPDSLLSSVQEEETSSRILVELCEPSRGFFQLHKIQAGPIQQRKFGGPSMSRCPSELSVPHFKLWPRVRPQILQRDWTIRFIHWQDLHRVVFAPHYYSPNISIINTYLGTQQSILLCNPAIPIPRSPIQLEREPRFRTYRR